MSASGAGGDRVRRLFASAADAGSIGAILFRGLGGILLAVGTAIASGILTLADVFIIPTQNFIQASGNLLTAFFGGAANIVGLGAAGSGQSVGPGGLFASPLSFPIAIGIVLLGFYLLLAFISEEDTTNFFPLIGTGLDIPTPGFADSEEESGDD